MRVPEIRILVISILFLPYNWIFAQNDGKTFFEQGNYLQAIKSFKEQLDSQGNFNTGLYYYLGSSYLELGKLSSQLYEESCYFGSLYYEQVIKHDPQNPLFYYFQGICLSGLNKIKQARDAFQQATKFTKEPYSTYSRIWQDAYDGIVEQYQSNNDQLESNTASIELNKHFSSVENVPSPKQSEDKHSLYNYLILLISNKQFERVESILENSDYVLLDISEEFFTPTGESIQYLYYHPLILKYLSKYFYSRALDYFLSLEGKLTTPEQIEAVIRKIGTLYKETDDAKALEYLKDKNDQFLKNLLGELYWENGKKDIARKIWTENLNSDEPEVMGYAGYFTAKYLNKYEEGLEACIKASSRQPNNQDLTVLLVDIYAMENELAEATRVLDDGIQQNEKNDPLFLLEYAKIMYANGSLRFNESLGSLYRLQQTNPIARQVHYYVQGLVASHIKERDGKLSK